MFKLPNAELHLFISYLRKHEYEKHGTCAASLEGFDDEHEYFQRALDLRDKHDMMK